MKELSVELHKLYHHYTPTRQRQQKTFLPDQLQKCDFVWVRLDRVKKPLEAPYRGPYRVIERKNDVFVLEVRGKPNSVSIERLKPAVVSPQSLLHDVPEDREVEREEIKSPVIEERKTRSGRRVRIKEDPEFAYF